MVLYLPMAQEDGSETLSGISSNNGDLGSLTTKFLDTLRNMMVLTLLQFMVLVTWLHNGLENQSLTWLVLGSIMKTSDL